MKKIYLLFLFLFFSRCNWAQGSAALESLPPLTELREVRRFAFIIGAEHYDFLGPASNATRDALEMVRILREANFQSIRFLPDPRDQVEIEEFMKDVHDWTGDVKQPVIVVFFYAGHGFMTKDRRPYIVPVGARSDHLLEDGVPLSSILSDSSFHNAGISLFLFDACRTGIPESSKDDEALTGFGPQPSIPKLRAETYIHYATEEGAPAQSRATIRNGNNSPFTAELLTFLPRPGISTQKVFDKVHTWVPIHTLSSQFTLEVSDGVLTNLYMLPTSHETQEERTAWANAAAAGSDECVKAFISEYPGSPYLALALSWPSNEQFPGSNVSVGGRGCEK